MKVGGFLFNAATGLVGLFLKGGLFSNLFTSLTNKFKGIPKTKPGQPTTQPPTKKTGQPTTQPPTKKTGQPTTQPPTKKTVTPTKPKPKMGRRMGKGVLGAAAMVATMYLPEIISGVSSLFGGGDDAKKEMEKGINEGLLDAKKKQEITERKPQANAGMGSGLGSLAGDAAMMGAMMGGPAAVKAVATKLKTPKPPKPSRIPAPKMPAVATAPATKPPLKPPAAKIGKIATKFPRMFKVLGFLKGIPGLGKTLAIAPILAAAAMGASVTELIPLIGAVLGGVLGWSGGMFLGGMIGAAGGPVALVTGALGGIAGGLLGDYLGTSLSQWIMGQKADGMPWGLGWIDDLLNSGKGSDDPVSKPIASKKPGASPALNLPTPPVAPASIGKGMNVSPGAVVKTPASIGKEVNVPLVDQIGWNPAKNEKFSKLYTTKRLERDDLQKQIEAMGPMDKKSKDYLKQERQAIRDDGKEKGLAWMKKYYGEADMYSSAKKQRKYKRLTRKVRAAKRDEKSLLSKIHPDDRSGVKQKLGSSKRRDAMRQQLAAGIHPVSKSIGTQAPIKLPPSVKQTPKAMIGAKPVKPSMRVNDKVAEETDWDQIYKARYAELGKVTQQDREYAVQFGIQSVQSIAADRVQEAKIKDEIYADNEFYRKNLAAEHKLALKKPGASPVLNLQEWKTQKTNDERAEQINAAGAAVANAATPSSPTIINAPTSNVSSNKTDITSTSKSLVNPNPIIEKLNAM
jgi:hypothetical protein